MTKFFDALFPDGVFRAKTQHQETVGAETILEGGETQVEKPIDQEEAQEVEEDQTVAQDHSKVKRKCLEFKCELHL